MKDIVIMADSTCDLPIELIEKYGIIVCPLHVHLDDKDYRDGIDITVDEIYEWSDKYNKTPKTSALSPYEAEYYLGKALSLGKHVLCFTISEKMSSCCSVLYMAVRSMDLDDRVHIIDSESLSSGIALQILLAADLIGKGYNLNEIVSYLNFTKSKVHASFVVNELTYLYRGGRCSGLSSLIGNSFRIHPIIYVENKEMHVGKFYRGKIDKTLDKYVADLTPLLLNARRERVFITHSGMDEKIINSVKKRIESLNYFNEVYVTRAGSIISSHCGPNTLGVLFIEN